MLNTTYFTEKWFKYYRNIYASTAVVKGILGLLCLCVALWRSTDSLPFSVFMLSFAAYWGYGARQAILRFRDGVLRGGLRRKVEFDGVRLTADMPGQARQTVYPTQCRRYYPYSETLELHDGPRFDLRAFHPSILANPENLFVRKMFREWWPELDFDSELLRARKRPGFERSTKRLLDVLFVLAACAVLLVTIVPGLFGYEHDAFYMDLLVGSVVGCACLYELWNKRFLQRCFIELPHASEGNASLDETSKEEKSLATSPLG